MTLVEIKKHINLLLKDNFKAVILHAGEVKEGFSRPSFFTQIIPISSDYDTKNYTSNRMIVVVNYFPLAETELECLKMSDDLRRVFGMTLEVGKRRLLLKNISSEINDKVLQFKFNLDYFGEPLRTKADRDGEYELMQEINTKISKGDD